MPARPAMLLESFAEFVDLTLAVSGSWNPADGQQWIAKLSDCAIVEGSLIGSVCGHGSTPEAALDNYARQIVGKTLRHNPYPYDTLRREIPVKCDFLAYVENAGPITFAEHQPF